MNTKSFETQPFCPIILGRKYTSFQLIGGITNNLNLGLIYKPSFQGKFEKLRLGFELLMFYYV